MKNKFKAAFVFLAITEGSIISLQAEELVGLYNQSSMVECKNSWDIIFTADYIYWTWQQAGMNVGTLINSKRIGAHALLEGKEEVVFQKPGYSSGFQIGLGFNFHGMDDWRLKADYTWLENVDHLRTVTGPGKYFAVSPTVIKTLRGLSSGTLLSGDLFSTAKLNFDELDTTLQRIWYQGKSLTARYSMGIKTLWMDEYAEANGADLSVIGRSIPFTVPLKGSFQTTSRIQSWALGPVFGLEASWLLGYGIRVEGNLRGSLVYTSYTQLQFSVTGQISDLGSVDLLMNQPNDYDTVSPILETSLGLGWGSYFCNQNLYLDLFAGYDFNVYWSRGVLDAVRNQGGSPGNICLQGLNIRAGIDF